MISILIRYLGIKTKLLVPIKETVKAVTPENGTVLDLFAGSNTVGQFLSDDFTILTNDCQHYSYVAAKALIERHSKKILNSLSEDEIYNKYYYANLKMLENIFKAPLEYEANSLDQIGEKYYGKVFDRYVDFFNNSPYCENTENFHSSYKDCLYIYSKENIELYKKDHTKFPYILFSTYYNNPYFSLHQCIEIDSLMYSLHMLLSTKIISAEKYNIYLSFLLYTLNLTVISVGDHFAQPQSIKPVSKNLDSPRDTVNLRERKKIINKKRLTIRSLLNNIMSEYIEKYVSGNARNKAFCMDYSDILKSNIIQKYNVSTVYIDPPYTNAHYSRFYHIPETLVLYDYPDIQYFGRYRTDRYQSDFCIRTEALQAFDNMLRLCKSSNLNAVISYSNTSQCILHISEIENVCKKYYGMNVRTKNIDHMYRNFGQKPNRVLAKEFIITCEAR
jgi:adenine-specific DNA methylase